MSALAVSIFLHPQLGLVLSFVPVFILAMTADAKEIKFIRECQASIQKKTTQSLKAQESKNEKKQPICADLQAPPCADQDLQE